VKSVMLTGANGLWGPYLAAAAAELGQVTSVSRRDAEYCCDLSDAAETERAVRSLAPDVVLHCAAMTSVDGCETSPDDARRHNTVASHNLAAALPPTSLLVYASTDQVYADVAGPHDEEESGPTNIYGQSKYDGEQAVLARENSLVLRVNFFGPSRTPGRQSLSDWLIDSLRTRADIKIFTDTFFSPLHLTTLSEVTIDAVRTGLRGVFNLGSRDGMSKCEFALALAQHLGLPTHTAQPAASTSVAGRAVRPHDLRMQVGKIESALGRTMPTLQQEISKL
jgi:dTDP-4-dehydrorhamnose reductase